MPQMSPMNWLMLYLFFTLSWLIVLTKSYFN